MCNQSCFSLVLLKKFFLIPALPKFLFLRLSLNSAPATFPSKHQSLSLHTRLKIPQHNFFPFCLSPPPPPPSPPPLILFLSSLPPTLRLFSQRTQKAKGPPSFTGTQCTLMLFNYRFIPIESALNHSSVIFKLNKTSTENMTNKSKSSL